MSTKFVFLGGGNMAEAIFSKLLNNSEFSLEIIQRNLEKAANLRHKYPMLNVRNTLDYALAPNDILILAIKPQHAKQSCSEIKANIQQCLIISVMAGLACTTIRSWCNNPRVIRSIPNIPSCIGLGVTAIYFPPEIEQTSKNLIQEIFARLGLNYLATDETELDKILPVTSSAIAFIYYFIEGMIRHSIDQFGFPPLTARTLVTQAVAGSVGMLQKFPEIQITELRAQVTSKKGTTAQGILTFEQFGLHQIISEAMQKCYTRAQELALEFDQVGT